MLCRFTHKPWQRLILVFGLFLAIPAHLSAAEASPKVYVILWFDTEDYLLPASDDAALRV